jgi:glycosyltransferase involved in cell wall biosynthesis
MRVLHLVAGAKWTGAAAVAHDWVAALRGSGIEAQLGFEAPQGPLASRLAGVGWARPLFSRGRDPVSAVRDARRLREMVRREGFEIVHVHSTHDHFLAAWALGRTGVPIVRTIHNARHVRRDPISRLLFARTEGFAFGNRDLAASFGRPGPVHLPVVDTDRFAPGPASPQLRRRLGIPDGAVVLGTVGKLSAGRGHAEAIEAAAPLGPGVVLLHVRPETSGRDTRKSACPTSTAFSTSSSSPPPGRSRVTARSRRRWPAAFRSRRSRSPALLT